MKLPHHGSASTILAEINITPMVDVMLVLLIIFMITAPLLQQGIDIALPEVSASSPSASQNDLVMSINGNGQIFLGNDSKNNYSLETLPSKLEAIFQNKEKKELYLKADKGIEYGYVVSVMALAQKAGVERLGMITSPEKPEKMEKGGR